MESKKESEFLYSGANFQPLQTEPPFDMTGLDSDKEFLCLPTFVEKLKEMTKRLKAEESSEETTDESSSGTSGYSDNGLDGGWGWVVCFGSFLINFIIDGTMFSFGILLLELLSYFGEGKAKTAWIGSAQLGMSMFMGPAVSILLERYTCRQITIGGAILSVGALVLSTFSPSVNVLILTYGFITGIGFSMAFISAIIVVGLNFNKKRAIATGIATSGSGLGTFAYAYLTNYLLQHYDWRGTVLILAGILANCIVCGAVFRPLTPKLKSRSRSSSDISTSEPSSHDTISDEEVKKLLREKPMFDRASYLRVFDESQTHEFARSTDLTELQGRYNPDVCHRKLFSSHSDINDLHRRRHHSDRLHTLNPMSKKDVFYSGSLARLSQFHGANSAESSETSSDTTENGGKPDSKCCKRWRDFKKALKTNGRMFKDKTFVLLLISNVLWTVQSVPLTYIPDLGVSKNIPKEQAALLISIVGFTNIIGRILSGVITDVFNIRSSVTYTVALFLACISNFMFPWCTNFTTLAFCCAVFGLCMATAVSMRTIVLADYLGIDKLTKAFGMVALFQGAAFITNAPLAGFLYEYFHSYQVPFAFSGTCYLFSALSCLAVHFVKPIDTSKTLVITDSEDSMFDEESGMKCDAEKLFNKLGLQESVQLFESNGLHVTAIERLDNGSVHEQGGDMPTITITTLEHDVEGTRGSQE